MALLLYPALVVVILACGLTTQHRLRAIGSGLLSLAGGLGLAAFFWVPALLENRYVKIESLRGGTFQWSNHILSPAQLLWSPWGYGLSVPGT